MTVLYVIAAVWALSCVIVALGEVARAFQPRADKAQHLCGAGVLTLLALPSYAYMVLT